MTATAPRFRRDLAVSRQATADGVIFVVKDPVRDRFYRLPEEAHFIGQQLDGETPLEVVRRRTEEKYRTSLPPAELNAFVHSLSAAGLLDTGRSGAGQSRRRRIQGSPLYLRIRLFDPDRLFNFLAPRIRFLFSPQFVAISALLILGAVYITFASWEEAVGNLSRLWHYSALSVILPVVFLVITAHEFAHGLTCKHFGGQVHELGFFLIYLQPAFYCNVSDAWLFPEKSKRLWVGAAGPYFELFVWAIATFLWRLTDPETWINYLGFIVMTTSGLKTLVNLNPLIKLDGYYLLSDWLEIANLRKKSFACFGDLIKKMCFLKTPRPDQMPGRERRVCLAYGLVAGIGSVWLLAFAVTKIGAALLRQTTPVALAISLWLLALKFRRRFRRWFGKSSTQAFDPDDPDSLDPTEDAPVREDPSSAERPSADPAPLPVTPATAPDPAAAAVWPRALESPPAPAPRRPKRRARTLKRVLGFALLGGTAAAALWFLHPELRIAGPFDVLPVQNADVRAGVEGVIDEICVDEGQRVHRGDLIARLMDRDARVQLQSTQDAIAEAQARLNLLLAGPRPEEIQQARIEVAKDAEAITFATSRRDRDQLLFNANLVSKQELEDSEANLAQQKSNWAEAKSKLDLLLAGSRPEEIEAMQAEVARLQTQHGYLQEQLRLMRVVSPADGIVATPSRQLMEMKHQLVKKGDLIAKVYDLKTITAEMAISERDIADIKIGQRVVLKARAYPELTFDGKVKSIATAAQDSTSSTASLVAQAQGTAPATLNRSALAPKTITITTEIDNGSLLLKPGMTGQAKIFCGRRRFLDLVTRRLARTVRVEFWSWW